MSEIVSNSHWCCLGGDELTVAAFVLGDHSFVAGHGGDEGFRMESGTGVKKRDEGEDAESYTE